MRNLFFTEKAYNTAPMLFKISIENFGKITQADIRIGDFTVFAGKNSTGKSYVSKAMYSLFRAMKTNHLAVVLNPYLLSLNRALSSLNWAFDEDEDEDEKMDLEGLRSELADMDHATRGLQDIVRRVAARDDVDEFDAIKEELSSIRIFLDTIEKAIPRLEEEVALVEGHPSMVFSDTRAIAREIDDVEEFLSELARIKNFDAEEFVKEGIRHEIKKNFLGNFQVPHMSYLLRKADLPACFNVEKFGVNVKIGEDINWTTQENGLALFMRQCSAVRYLESPIFWRLKDALDNIKIESNSPRITGIPEYFYDLSGALRAPYPGESAFPEILEKLTGDNVLKGRVGMGETGDLFFQGKKERKHPLRLAATGIANLGILALLIEKNLMNKNTFLFIDEPEAHLHPAWQVEMAAALFALSQKGVKVVIATHSADILKWLEVEVNTPELQKTVALNHFINGTVRANDAQFDEKLSIIQKDLAEPYYKLYYKGL